ncbi:unnamed protein product [Protopolystoma xenopodis]|uniref:Uncharacterized protein n=1 Tax=Protopolystoma xenopodis TaxID=117903 RepID=A0A3S5C838_9PLAT|nr:unnamed protein product [Protopolystoma xenopodis]
MEDSRYSPCLAVEQATAVNFMEGRVSPISHFYGIANEAKVSLARTLGYATCIHRK